MWQYAVSGTGVPDTSLSGHFIPAEPALTLLRWRQGNFTAVTGTKISGPRPRRQSNPRELRAQTVLAFNLSVELFWQPISNVLESLFGHQKFSICHTLRVVLAPAMTMDRPSGDGIAPNISGLLERNRTKTLPSSVTSARQYRSHDAKQGGEISIHGPFDTTNSSHSFTFSSRVSPVTVERSRIVPLSPSQTMARCKPSGDKLQLHEGSTWAAPSFCRSLQSKWNVSVFHP